MFKETFSDLLFGVTISGQDGYIYFLFEHKSYVSKGIALQMLEYIVDIWEQKFVKENDTSLPIIIPIVIYHGQHEWTHYQSLAQLIKGFDELPTYIQQFVPNYELILFDLSQFREEDIKGAIKLQVFLDIFIHIFDEADGFIITLEKHVQQLFEVIKEQPDIVTYFKTYIKYILSVRDELTVEDVHQLVHHISQRGGDLVATAADELRKEGKIEVAKNLLQLNVEEEQILMATNLSEKEMEQIKKELK